MGRYRTHPDTSFGEVPCLDPASANQPFSAFPGDFTRLPTLSFVVARPCVTTCTTARPRPATPGGDRRRAGRPSAVAHVAAGDPGRRLHGVAGLDRPGEAQELGVRPDQRG